MIIDGEKIAGGIIAELKAKFKPEKNLTVIQVGNEPTMVSFIKKKEAIAREIGIRFEINRNPESTDGESLRQSISEAARNPECGGIVLQLPLPARINRGEMIREIPPQKDVDNLSGKSPVLAPAALVVEKIIQSTNYDLKNATVAVVGLGILVGKPVSEWLTDKCARLLTFDSGSDLGKLKEANVIISGVGQAGLIKTDLLKEETLVIDFGYEVKDGKTRGDFGPKEVDSKNITYTPTPGGTGPILVAALFENFYKLNSL